MATLPVPSSATAPASATAPGPTSVPTPVPVPALDRFLRYDELTEALRALAGDICTVEEIGRSHEGRPIWLATLTDPATGPHDQKPALWVDANIHASEVTGSAAALDLVHRLVAGHAAGDRRIVELLGSRTVYVVPRVNPDGAEVVLSDRPRYLRSSVRPWPWPLRASPGLRIVDVDGDGRLLQMRWPDPNGRWKAHGDDPRLMVRRSLTDGPDDGPYYRVAFEGTVEDFDGWTVPAPVRVEGLDLNRNFPAGWRVESDQPGAGPFPASEPEVSTVVRAVAERANVAIYVAYHTAGGFFLRPSSSRPDVELPWEDVRVYQEILGAAEQLCGYPSYSTYEAATPRPKDAMTGAADDWTYEHLGIYSMTTEFWDVGAAAGLPRTPPLTAWVEGTSVEHDLAVLRWLDERWPGRYVQAWRAFDHPQLGPVEIGGWDFLFCVTNPPVDVLADEVRPLTDVALLLAGVTPHLRIVATPVEPLGEAAWRVRVVVENDGWLPTHVTWWAKEKRLVGPVAAEIEVAPPASLPAGARARQELGQLAGKVLGTPTSVADTTHDGTSDRALAEWVVLGPAGAMVTVTVRHPRAGTVRVSVPLA